jgi:ankyrin repeat protein
VSIFRSSRSQTDPLHLDQQRKLAKELLRAARSQDSDVAAGALARLRAVRTDAGAPARELKLADAQLAIAREAGFASWPKLVAAGKERDLEAFRDAVGRRDVAQVTRLLAELHVRARVNDPMFDFGQRATHVAANDRALIALLLDAGADLNLPSDWQNGPFTVLDRADEPAARFLLARGATLTPNVAARLGWFDELAAMLRADPALVHARGGDGQQPLHEARSLAIADLLLERGADIDARCIDHRSTPAQYALVERPEVARHLLQRGATPDIFMAARLGDLALAERLLDADPAAVTAEVNGPGYAPVPPFNIYCWSLGFAMSPHAVAKRYGHDEVFDLLTARSSPRVLLRTALFANDAARARAIVASDPSLVASLSRAEHGWLAQAIFHEALDAAHIMLDLGFDPSAPGVDGGTALHAACWVGNVRLVERILERRLEKNAVPLDAPDPTHQSPPLGWTAYGSAQRRSRGGDYPAVAQRLVAAGANIHASGNLQGRTLIEMAKGNPEMQEALRRLGAA